MPDKLLFDGSIAIALLMVVLSWRWKSAARALYALLFLAAGIFNLVTVFTRMDEYALSERLAYGSWAQRFFLHHTTAIVVAIAIGELLVAVLMTLRNWPVTVGSLGAVLFLLGIVPLGTPLGTAAGFPVSAILAFGALLLMTTTFASTLWAEIGSGFWHHPRAHTVS